MPKLVLITYFLITLLSCEDKSGRLDNNLDPLSLNCGKDTAGKEQIKIFRKNGNPYQKSDLVLYSLDENRNISSHDPTENACFSIPINAIEIEIKTVGRIESENLLFNLEKLEDIRQNHELRSIPLFNTDTFFSPAILVEELDRVEAFSRGFHFPGSTEYEIKFGVPSGLQNVAYCFNPISPDSLKQSPGRISMYSR